MYAYDRWACRRQLDACARLTPEQLLRSLGGSFSSLHLTLVHLVAVEWLWLERWRGRNPTALIGADELPTLAAVVERWEAVDRELRSWLDGLDEQALALHRTCVSTRGERWT